MTYLFRDSFRRFNDQSITPETAGKELERIHKEHGTLRAHNVVEEARPDEAPLHPAFEWNDPVAAELYRCEQARSLIKTVQVVRSNETDPEPVYVNVSTKESAYEPMTKVVNTPDMADKAFPASLGGGTHDCGVWGDYVDLEAALAANNFEIAFSQACARVSGAERALAELQQVARCQRRPEADRYQRAERLLGQVRNVMIQGF